MLRYRDVQNISASSAVPGRAPRNGSDAVRLVRQSEKISNSCDVVYIDESFLETFDLKLSAGRNFSLNFSDNGKSVLINEAALRLFEHNQPEMVIGEKILVYGDTLQIVGVLKDFHQESLRKKIEPIIFVCDHGTSTYYSVKIKSKKSTHEILNTTEKAYKESFAGNPFNTFFLDDYFNEQYQSDRQFGTVFSLFTIIGIAIACLGLFGLSSYLVLHRTKEIGIRKVLGASVQQIAVLVSKEFIMIVVFANIIACPIYYLLMNDWLENFASRIRVDVLSFLIPAMLVVLIAIFTVAVQSIKAAVANPINHLRDE